MFIMLNISLYCTIVIFQSIPCILILSEQPHLYILLQTGNVLLKRLPFCNLYFQELYIDEILSQKHRYKLYAKCKNNSLNATFSMRCKKFSNRAQNN